MKQVTIRDAVKNNQIFVYDGFGCFPNFTSNVDFHRVRLSTGEDCNKDNVKWVLDNQNELVTPLHEKCK